MTTPPRHVHRQPSGGRPPHVLFKCLTCGVEFAGRGQRVDGIEGKACPEGHWHPMHALQTYRHTGFKPGERPRKPVPGHNRVAVPKTWKGTPAELATALEWMLDGYDKLVLILPERSQARRLIEGAFGQVVVMARRLITP